MPEFVDLRSDTVTQPTPEMRRVIAEAEVGDDVLEDDPTAKRLQEMAARMLGKEAGLLVPTGTMSNAIATKTHTRPGDEVLMDWDAHSMYYEVGMPATIAQVVTRQFRSQRGVPALEEIVNAIHTETVHTPGTTLILLENTHNRAGGAVIPLEVQQEVWRLAQERGISLHLDGARLFNAAVASGHSAAEFAACADTVTFALSKGLGCPIGSVLCGSSEFIARAKRVRKMLGGGMRQVGILAAAGIYALEHNIARLAEDHANARRLVEGLSGLPGIGLDMPEIPTNMVYFTTPIPALDFAERLEKEYQVRCISMDAYRLRMVTHLDVDVEGIERAITAVREVAVSLS